MSSEVTLPTWLVALSTAMLLYGVYAHYRSEQRVDQYRNLFPYTVEGLRLRGHPIHPAVQQLADQVDAINQLRWGNWDDPNIRHW